MAMSMVCRGIATRQPARLRRPVAGRGAASAGPRSSPRDVEGASGRSMQGRDAGAGAPPLEVSTMRVKILYCTA